MIERAIDSSRFAEIEPGHEPAALGCNQVVNSVNPGIEQLEIPLKVEAIVADRGGLARLHCFNVSAVWYNRL